MPPLRDTPRRPEPEHEILLGFVSSLPASGPSLNLGRVKASKNWLMAARDRNQPLSPRTAPLTGWVVREGFFVIVDSGAVLRPTVEPFP